MGSSCFVETKRKHKKDELNSLNSDLDDFLLSNEKYKKEINELNNIITKYEEEINELNKSIVDKKESIFNKMDESDDNQVKKEIDEYYKLLNLIKEKNSNFNSFKNTKSDLDNLLKKDIEEFDEKRIPTEWKKNSFEKKLGEIKTLKEIKQKISDEKYSPNDLNTENKNNINKFYKLREDIDNLINDIENRKQKFRNEFNKKIYESFIYPTWLMDSLDENLNLGVNSFVNYKKDLNDINQQIKEEIKNILNNNNFNNNITLILNNYSNYILYFQEIIEENFNNQSDKNIVLNYSNYNFFYLN